MKDSLRQCAAWLHTWTGLVTGWILFFVFVTGTAGYFQLEITRWMQPELAGPAVRQLPATGLPADSARSIDLALAQLGRVAPDAASWQVNLPHESVASRSMEGLSIRWQPLTRPGQRGGRGTTQQLDEQTGQVEVREVEPRSTAGGRALYRMHYELHYLSYDLGIRIVGVCTMLMLLAIVTGVITHKKIFTDFFTFRPGKGQRSWLDAHNAVSVMALPFFLMITYSGLVFFLFTYMPAGHDALYGSESEGRSTIYAELYERSPPDRVAVSRPQAALQPMLDRADAEWGRGQIASLSVERQQGQAAVVTLTRQNGGSLDFWTPPKLRFDADTGESLGDRPRVGGSATRTQQVLFGLHEGNFATIWGRWVYFFAGLLGCAMIGTGLVLWTVKRRKHHLGSGRESQENLGVRLVENLNVATIAGLPLAVAAYFWANRLLALDLADRAAWEMHSLFAVWLGTLFYAMARPLARAWIELLWATCAAYALLPLLNALTTSRHLGHSLAQGDWVFAGFDLTMLGLAVMFAFMARKVTRRLTPAVAPVPVAVLPKALGGKGLA